MKKAGLVSNAASSSAECRRQKTSAYRRIVVSDDSLDSSSAVESVDVNAVRADHSGTSSDLNESILDDDETKSSGDVHGTDSFIVSDNEFLTDDASFLSRSSEAELSPANISSTKRAQPPRRAKVETGEELFNRVHEAYFSASESNLEVKHSKRLQHRESSTREVFINRDNLRVKSSPSSVQEECQEKQSQRLVDSEESDVDTDERFEIYLKKLRDSLDTKNKRSACEQIPLSSFIVSDSDVSSPSSVCESEASDVSWSPDDECDEESSKEQDELSPDNLISSVKHSLGRSSLLSRKTKEIDQDEHFLISLSPEYVGKRHPDAEIYLKKGIKKKNVRNELTKRLFDIFRIQCFNEELPELFTIKWNSRLRKTAGLCRNNSDRTSWIELSPKVCSTPDRIRDTLVHEMCHAAVWIVDGVTKEGHGPIWKKWASRCMQRFRSLPIIARCHDYEIEAKFIYECGGCGQKVKRHTKSLDISRKICAICKCSFTLTTPSHARTPSESGLGQNPFAKFVKENYSKYKKPGMKHGEVMRTLSQLYKANASIESIENADPGHELDISVLSIND